MMRFYSLLFLLLLLIGFVRSQSWLDKIKAKWNKWRRRNDVSVIPFENQFEQYEHPTRQQYQQPTRQHYQRRMRAAKNIFHLDVDGVKVKTLRSQAEARGPPPLIAHYDRNGKLVIAKNPVLGEASRAKYPKTERRSIPAPEWKESESDVKSSRVKEIKEPSFVRGSGSIVEAYISNERSFVRSKFVRTPTEEAFSKDTKERRFVLAPTELTEEALSKDTKELSRVRAPVEKSRYKPNTLLAPLLEHSEDVQFIPIVANAEQFIIDLARRDERPRVAPGPPVPPVKSKDYGMRAPEKVEKLTMTQQIKAHRNYRNVNLPKAQELLRSCIRDYAKCFIIIPDPYDNIRDHFLLIRYTETKGMEYFPLTALKDIVTVYDSPPDSSLRRDSRRFIATYSKVDRLFE